MEGFFDGRIDEVDDHLDERLELGGNSSFCSFRHTPEQKREQTTQQDREKHRVDVDRPEIAVAMVPDPFAVDTANLEVLQMVGDVFAGRLMCAACRHTFPDPLTRSRGCKQRHPDDGLRNDEAAKQSQHVQWSDKHERQYKPERGQKQFARLAEPRSSQCGARKVFGSRQENSASEKGVGQDTKQTAYQSRVARRPAKNCPGTERYA